MNARHPHPSATTNTAPVRRAADVASWIREAA